MKFINIKFSTSRKSLMKLGIGSIAVFTLFVAAFFALNFVLPAFAGLVPGVQGGPTVWLNISATDANQTDQFLTCGNVLWFRANISCSADTVCNSSLRATANLTDINYNSTVYGQNVSTVDGLGGYRLFEFNGTVNCTGRTISSFQTANISVNASTYDGTSGDIGWTIALLVNMSSFQGCPPEGENVQMPPVVMLLNGTIVNTIQQCWSNCTTDDVAQQYNSTHFTLCGPTFGGSTTNFTQSAYNGNFSAIPLVIEIPGRVKINFTTPVNFSDQQKSQAIMEFAMKNMMSGGRVGVNETEWNGAGGKPDLRVAAQLTFYNVSGLFGIAPPHMPVIGRRATYGAGGFSVCGAACSGITWDGQNITFTVSSFSEYEVSQGLAVGLNTPANFSVVGNYSFVTNAPFRNVNFTFTPKWNSSSNVRNATLFGNFTNSGAWTANASNATFLTNNTVYGINFSVPADRAYLWNIVLYDNSSPAITDTNAINWTVTVDTVEPATALIYPQTGNYIRGNSSEPFTITVIDSNLNTSNVTLHYRVVGGGWDTRYLTCTASGTNYTCVNYTDISSVAVSGDTIEYYYEATDLASNFVNNGSISSPMTLIVDRDSPQWSGNATSTASGTQYNLNRAYGFQINWADAKIGNVTIEHNFTGTSANYTASNSSTVFYYNLTGIAAGGYVFKWFANDSVVNNDAANWNASSQWVYTVAKNASMDSWMALGFNDTANTNAIIIYPAAINATGNKTVAEGNLTLLRNGTSVSIGLNLPKEEIRLGNATWNYTLMFNETQNYTTKSITYWLIVQKGATTITYYINDTSTSSNVNRTIGSGMAMNITILPSNTQGFVLLQRDGAEVQASGLGGSLKNVTAYTGTAGQQWNISSYYNGSANYTQSSTTFNYLIIEGVAPTSVPVTPNITNNTIIGTAYPKTINLSAVWNDNVSDVVTLDKWWLWSNETGAGVNQSAVRFTSSNESWYNLSVASFSANVTFMARIYANDTSGNENVSQTYMWKIDGTTPTLNGTTPSNSAAITGSAIELFQVHAYDEMLNTANVTLNWRRQALTWNTVTLTCYNQSENALVAIGGDPRHFICNNTVNLAALPSGSVIEYFFNASDNSTITFVTSTYSVTKNTNPPQIAYNATNITNNSVIPKGRVIGFDVRWTDDTGLSGWKILANDSLLGNLEGLFSGLDNWGNATLATSALSAGKVFRFNMSANDTFGNTNNYTLTWQFQVDNTAPSVLLNETNVTNASTIARGTPINISVNWTENIGADKWWVETNYSSADGSNATLNSYNLFTLNNVSNYSLSTSGITNGARFWVRIFANDTTGNEGVSDKFFWTIDGTVPTYGNVTSGNTVSANSNEYAYNPGASYYFNITIYDNLAVSKVLFEWNGTNETSAEASTFNYSIIKTDLGYSAINYTFRWFMNDSSDNWNVTSVRTFNITKNSTAAYTGLALNGTEANSSYTYPGAVNASAWRNFTELGNLSLWRNGVIVASSLTNSIVSQEIVLGNATYNYSMTFSATNYTDRSVVFGRLAMVNKGNVSVSLAINDTEAGSETRYPAVVNITGWRNSSTANEGNFTLWRNDTIVSSKLTSADSVAQVIRLYNATWNLTVTYTGTNYTDSSLTYLLTVWKGVTNVSLWLNDAEANNTIQRGVAANFTATVNTTYGVKLNLTFDLTAAGTFENVGAVDDNITNITSTAVATAANNYNITAFFVGDQNYTSDIQTYWLNITADLTPPTVLVYDINSNSYPNGSIFRKAGASLTLNISVTDAESGPGAVCNVSLNATFITNLDYSSGWCNGTITIPAASAIGPDGNKTLNITINDTQQNRGSNTSLVVTIDNTAPTMTITVPAAANLTYNKTDSAGRVWINGTISDNIKLSQFNITMNGTVFAINVFTGVDATTFAIRNASEVADGLVQLSIGFMDNATNLVNVTVQFYSDNTRPTEVTGWTNSSMPQNSTQLVQVSVGDNLQTVRSITLHYCRYPYDNCNLESGSNWQAATMTGEVGSSTVYNATIDTSRLTTTGSVVYYYVAGTDNATNNMASNNGTFSSPLANFTVATTGTIQGYIYLTNSSSVPNATSSITVSDGTRTVNPNSAGFYQITSVPSGTYTLTASGTGYWTNSTSVTVVTGVTSTKNMQVTGPESFNVTVPGTATASSTNSGFLESGWNAFWLQTGIFAEGTTNTTIESLFKSIGRAAAYNYSSVWRYNSTTGGWASFIPGTTGNSMTSATSGSELYYVKVNRTDRVEIEARYV